MSANGENEPTYADEVDYEDEEGFIEDDLVMEELDDDDGMDGEIGEVDDEGASVCAHDRTCTLVECCGIRPGTAES